MLQNITKTDREGIEAGVKHLHPEYTPTQKRAEVSRLTKEYAKIREEV